MGYEIYPFCYNERCAINYDTIVNIQNSDGWYYKVTLIITDSISTIEKIPIHFSNSKDSIPYTDSSALKGYFLYTILTPFKKNSFGGVLKYCKYCTGCGSAVCRYKYAGYSFSQSGKNLIMSYYLASNIYFEKQD